MPMAQTICNNDVTLHQTQISGEGQWTKAEYFKNQTRIVSVGH
jgi:hypothetical protein